MGFGSDLVSLKAKSMHLFAFPLRTLQPVPVVDRQNCFSASVGILWCFFDANWFMETNCNLTYLCDITPSMWDLWVSSSVLFSYNECVHFGKGGEIFLRKKVAEPSTQENEVCKNEYFLKRIISTIVVFSKENKRSKVIEMKE